MAVLPDYVTGTITLANGSTTVTGTGTMFTTAAFRPGDTLQIQNLTAIIASVNSNTSLTLTAPWTGTSLTNAPYRARYLPDGARVTAQTTTLIELLGNGNLQALAGLTSAADTLAYFTGVNGMGVTGLTAFARSLLDDTDAATALVTLGLTGDSVAQMMLDTFGVYVTTATDLNSLTPGTRGLYSFVSGSTNFPETSGIWFVETQRIYSNGSVRQTATLYNQDIPRIYVRMKKADGTWGAWRMLTAQEGTNSNGWYGRYADGTQICIGTNLSTSGSTTASGSVFKTANVGWTFPSSFVASPSVVGSTNSNNAWVTAEGATTSANIACFLPFSFTGSLNLRVAAIGRWYL
ncbi:pyocin knob domain-containing protein [Brucella cytisi]|uniref:Tail fiber protein n=1 Tax=Brucella cytisi TaxID=407152 RepID=A0A1J6HHF3_9HYPH|nr:pyocin knob domain-containing protein [Brucella cytisi]OIS91921.1 hypothetical protein BLA27_18570 [Brucella cytisi]